MGEEVIYEWIAMRKQMLQHDYPTKTEAEEVLHGVKPADLQAASDIKLKFNPDYYRILT